jgi:hypothetical protein
LTEPSKRVERLVDNLCGAVAMRAEDQASQINGQEPARASSLSTAEEAGSSGKRQNGVQSGCRFHTIDQSEEQIATADSERAPTDDFPGHQCGDL